MSRVQGGDGGGWSRGRFAHTFAAIDLGTNNCRLLVARAAVDGFEVVDAFSRPVRLGQGVAASGELCGEAIDRTLDALGVCASKIRRNNVTRARHIATEACRRACNGEDFLAEVERRTGLRFEVIPPEEEARLALTGCEDLVDPALPWLLLVDIGGGSTEVTWVAVGERSGGWCGIDTRIVDMVSVPWGVVTLSETATGVCAREAPLPATVYEGMVGRLVAALEPFDRKNGIAAEIAAGRAQMVGTSGTVTTVAALHQGLRRYSRACVDGSSIEREAIVRVGASLAAKSVRELAELPCIGPDRADLALAGGAILEAICRLWPVPRVAVADRGLREGLLMDMMRRADRESDPLQDFEC